jgi:hypothetical protein
MTETNNLIPFASLSLHFCRVLPQRGFLFLKENSNDNLSTGKEKNNRRD